MAGPEAIATSAPDTRLAQSTTGVDPARIAADIVAGATRNGTVDISAVKAGVAAVKAQDATLGGQVEQAVLQSLSPVQRGQYLNATYTQRAPDGAPITFANDAPTVRQDFTAPANADRAALYARFDRIWGDGNPRTDDVARIETGLRTLQASGLSLAEYEAQAQPQVPPPAGPDPVQLGLDLTQMTLDITGIIEPTPFSDGANAIISGGRAIGSVFSGDGWGALGHLGNGIVSGVSILPYLGDTAKVAKIAKWAQTVSDSITAIARNPALRATLEPALREVRDLVGRIPQGALDALPQGARESIQGMKRQLDEFFGGGARAADDVPSYTGTVRGSPVVLDGVRATPVNYVKRDRAEYDALRRAFDSGARADFARSLVATPESIAALRRAGLDDAAIARLADGRIPQGWQVHHKLPLDDGGTNAFDNLVLIKNDPYHIALTNAQRALVGDLPVGGSRQVDFPIPDGFVYPPRP